MTEVINFASRKMPHFNFSNFALWEINVDGLLFTTTEHYYQASKFIGTDNFKKVLMAKTPFDASKLGRSLKMERPENWDAMKDNVMWKAVYAKFTQHTHLRDELLGTGDTILVEHRKADSYWGDGGNGKGVNMLGFQLMALRHLIRGDHREYMLLVRDLFKQKYEHQNLLVVVLGGTGLITNTNSLELSFKLPSNYLGVSIEMATYKTVVMIGSESEK